MKTQKDEIPKFTSGRKRRLVMRQFSLPIETQLCTSSYLAHALPLSIIQVQPDFSDSWVCDKMINFVYHATYLNKFMVYNTDWHFIGCGAIKENSIFFSNDCMSAVHLIDFVRESLHNGIYITGNHNEKYIPGKNAYMKWDMPHEYLIFGDDPEKQIFRFVGYNAGSSFMVYEAAYQDYVNSLYNVFDKGMCFLLLRPQPLNCTPDMDMLIHGLSDYYRSRDTVQYDEKGIFGFEAIETLAFFVADQAKSDGYIDQKYIRSYFEHKNMMSIRMRYLSDAGLIDKSIADDYTPIKQTAEKIHFLTIKNNMVPQRSRVQKIKDMILSNQAEELHIFDKIQPMLKLS